MDLSFLTPEEKEQLLAVLSRDEEIRSREDARIK